MRGTYTIELFETVPDGESYKITDKVFEETRDNEISYNLYNSILTGTGLGFMNTKTMYITDSKIRESKAWNDIKSIVTSVAPTTNLINWTWSIGSTGNPSTMTVKYRWDPPASVDRTINAIYMSSSGGSAPFSVMSSIDISDLTVTQSTTQVLDVTYILYIEHDLITTNIGVSVIGEGTVQLARWISGAGSPYYPSYNIPLNTIPDLSIKYKYFSNSLNGELYPANTSAYDTNTNIMRYPTERKSLTTGTLNSSSWKRVFTTTEATTSKIGMPIAGLGFSGIYGKNPYAIQDFTDSGFINKPIQPIHNHNKTAITPFLNVDYLASGTGEFSVTQSGYNSYYPFLYFVNIHKTGYLSSSSPVAQYTMHKLKLLGGFYDNSWSLSSIILTYIGGYSFSPKDSPTSFISGINDSCFSFLNIVPYSETHVMSTNGNGVHLRNVFTGWCRIFSNESGAFPSTCNIRQIIKDSLGNIWAGCRLSGLYKISSPTGSFSVTKQSGGGIVNNTACYGVSVGKDDTILSIFPDGVYYSTNYGTTWTKVDNYGNLTDFSICYGIYTGVLSDTKSSAIAIRQPGTSKFAVNHMSIATAGLESYISGLSGLILYYKCNETSGTVCTDYSGNNYHGTYNSAVVNTTSLCTRSGTKSVTLAGTAGSYIGVPNLTISNSNVASFVFYIDRKVANGTAFSCNNFTIFINSSNIRINNGSDRSSGFNPIQTDYGSGDQLMTVVIVINGSNFLLYINGEYYNTTSTATNINLASLTSVKFGSNGSAGWTGRMSNLAVFNRVLTAKEISELHIRAINFNTFFLTSGNIVPASDLSDVDSRYWGGGRHISLQDHHYNCIAIDKYSRYFSIPSKVEDIVYYAGTDYWVTLGGRYVAVTNPNYTSPLYCYDRYDNIYTTNYYTGYYGGSVNRIAKIPDSLYVSQPIGVSGYAFKFGIRPVAIGKNVFYGIGCFNDNYSGGSHGFTESIFTPQNRTPEAGEGYIDFSYSLRGELTNSGIEHYNWNGASFEKDYNTPANDYSSNNIDATRVNFMANSHYFHSRNYLDISGSVDGSLASNSFTFITDFTPHAHRNTIANLNASSPIELDEPSSYCTLLNIYDPVNYNSFSLLANKSNNTLMIESVSNGITTTATFSTFVYSNSSNYRLYFTVSQSGATLQVGNYVDGILTDYGSVSFTTVMAFNSGTLDATIGATMVNPIQSIRGQTKLYAQRFFKGYLGHIQLWDTQLTGTDFSSDWGNRATTKMNTTVNSSYLKGWWKLDDVFNEAREVHTTSSTIDGVSINFTDGSNPLYNSFVIDDFYTFGMFNGILKDNAISYNHTSKLLLVPNTPSYSNVYTTLGTDILSSTAGTNYITFKPPMVGSSGLTDRTTGKNTTQWNVNGSIQGSSAENYKYTAIPLVKAGDWTASWSIPIDKLPTVGMDIYVGIGLNQIIKVNITSSNVSIFCWNGTILSSIYNQPNTFSFNDLFKIEKVGNTYSFYKYVDYYHNQAVIGTLFTSWVDTNTYTFPSTDLTKQNIHFGCSSAQDIPKVIIHDLTLTTQLPENITIIGDYDNKTGMFSDNFIRIDLESTKVYLNGVEAFIEYSELALAYIDLTAPTQAGRVSISSCGFIKTHPSDSGKTISVTTTIYHYNS